MKIFKKIILISILFIFFFIITVNSYANSISQKLSDTFFRLHILANSDSEEDQILKLKVRDAIIGYMNSIIKENMSKNEIIELCKKNKSNLEKIAQNIILENGYSYDVNITIGKFSFPTKNYGNISLPSGKYDALRIEIGNAIGQNWWCSLFPPLCFVDISSGVIDTEGEEYLKENLSHEEFSIISGNSLKIKFKFKIIEFFNEK